MVNFVAKNRTPINVHSSARAAQNVPIFKLPLEIKRMILTGAFGGTRLHLEVKKRRKKTGAGETKEGDGTAKLIKGQERAEGDGDAEASTRKDSVTDKDDSLEWRVAKCQRATDQGWNWQSRENEMYENRMYGTGPCGSWKDSCAETLHGLHDTKKLYDNIGVLGFLTSCRAAYEEGIEVLYQTNTFSLLDQRTIETFDQLLVPEHRAMIKSLELEWPLSRTVKDTVIEFETRRRLHVRGNSNRPANDAVDGVDDAEHGNENTDNENVGHTHEENAEHIDGEEDATAAQGGQSSSNATNGEGSSNVTNGEGSSNVTNGGAAHVRVSSTFCIVLKTKEPFKVGHIDDFMVKIPRDFPGLKNLYVSFEGQDVEHRNRRLSDPSLVLSRFDRVVQQLCLVQCMIALPEGVFTEVFKQAGGEVAQRRPLTANVLKAVLQNEKRSKIILKEYCEQKRAAQLDLESVGVWRFLGDGVLGYKREALDFKSCDYPQPPVNPGYWVVKGLRKAEDRVLLGMVSSARML